MYDLIGDIHGQSGKLTLLLQKMGYEKQNGCYRHSERKALFIGDYIDRGPDNPGTLKIVRSMVESNSAIALMGNHEYNALLFAAHNPKGGHLRPHSIKNILQHIETLTQFRHNQDEFQSYLDWFHTLPLWFENDDFRAVHAAWDKTHIQTIASALPQKTIPEEYLAILSDKSSPLYHAVEETLKGKEMRLPDGLHFTDKDGNQRNEIRIRWWMDPRAATWRDYSVIRADSLPNQKIPNDSVIADSFYG
ncbi:MAG: metallophosphoesterase, partial [Leptospiraceae bacterium]|nr:metallophosphoesterase [Leptospiraceae bacterium]